MIVNGKHFPVIQTLGLPKGTPAFEEKRSALFQAFWSKVPAEYLLPADVIKNPPIDVSKIPSTCGLLTAQEIEITETHDCTSLAEAIATKKYTAVAVATAFGKRSIICHQLTCCLTQWFMDSAIEQAKALDDYLEKNGQTIGPLHGVPISIKEHMPMAGTFSSQGSFGSTVKDEKDSHLIGILRDLGAVFYCKTNQPQAIMHLESDSHFGRVLNPFNIHLSAGGSTGGEAALIAIDALSDPKFASFLEIKDFKPHGAKEAWSKIRRMYWPEGGQATKDAIAASGEPILPLSDWIWKDAEPHGMLDAVAISDQRFERDAFRCEFADSWTEQDVDVVIGPAFVGPACHHDTSLYWTYTSLYNFVDYPGVVFPTPISAQAREDYAPNYEKLSDECGHVKKLWEEGGFEGAPINLQINARKYHDNDLFGALAVLRDVLGLE
ncbi:hypothetical protein EG328_006604 [Venturia inaequalis]|uniref:Amidase domain-containing protein n=1 Tax=Venturia inaequalis TaxID=5025 RepID=A0A8H3YS41_VENIN|nr:hypothetical protein EG328_006604 [Venturia inaequalis]